MMNGGVAKPLYISLYNLLRTSLSKKFQQSLSTVQKSDEVGTRKLYKSRKPGQTAIQRCTRKMYAIQLYRS